MSIGKQNIIGSQVSFGTPSLRGSSFTAISTKQRLEVFRARQRELREMKIHYVGDEAEFRAKGSWEKIVESPEPPSDVSVASCASASDTEHLHHALKYPPLTREQEQYLFRKMNYLKFVASEVRETLSAKRVEQSKVARIDELLEQAKEIRDTIVERNLRLVLNVGLTFLPRQASQCVSIGVPALMEVVDRFEYQRGVKLSTYAIRALKWTFLRHAQSMARSKQAFHARALSLGEYDVPDTVNADPFNRANTRGHAHTFPIEGYLAKLDPREKELVVKRFGLYGQKSHTLQEVGDIFGVSKERARQLEVRALHKLFGMIPIEDAFPD